MSRRSLPRPGLALLGALALTPALAACGSNDSGSSKDRTVKVAISDAGCEPATLKIQSGPTRFEVENRGTTKVSEYEILDGKRIIGERENIVAGIGSSFSLNLKPGTYETYCPGGDTSERGKLVVTGAAVPTENDPQLAAAEKTYRAYIQQQVTPLVAATQKFAAAVEAGNVAQAKALYAPTRAYYERIEPVAESFGDLDPKIDARVNDVEQGTPWTGFHRIEKALWQDNSTKGMAPIARQLVKDVQDLQKRVGNVGYEAAQIANGAQGLLDEISKSKITGEEDRYSHTDLVDFAANIEGSKAAFEAVRPALESRDKALAVRVQKQFGNVEAALATYRKGSGYVSYTVLTKADTRKLSQAIDALAEPLSQVAPKITGATT